MLDLLLFSACIWLVVSEKINTDNILKLVGIGFVAVGSLVEYAGHDKGLVEIGVLLYFSANLIHAYFGSRKRRYYDKINYDN